MQKANILGTEFSFVDGKLNISGIDFYSGTNVKMTSTQEKKNNAGMSVNAVSRGRGMKEHDVSFELSLKDTVRLRNLIPSRSLLDMPPSAAIYIMDSLDSKRVVTASFFEFTNDGVEVATGDTEARFTYTGICSDISNIEF